MGKIQQNSPHSSSAWTEKQLRLQLSTFRATSDPNENKNERTELKDQSFRNGRNKLQFPFLKHCL